jgi:hypothetical protein
VFTGNKTRGLTDCFEELQKILWCPDPRIFVEDGRSDLSEGRVNKAEVGQESLFGLGINEGHDVSERLGREKRGRVEPGRGRHERKDARAEGKAVCLHQEGNGE